jgi:dynein regulatory complex protein 1
MDRHGDDAAPTMAQRIAARRSALEAKRKASQRQQAGDLGSTGPTADGKEGKDGKGEEQVATSRRELSHLKTGAAEAVTRYRVLTDAHEGQRRIREEALSLDRRTKVVEDTDSSTKAQGHISMSFNQLFKQDHDSKPAVPQELMKDLVAQRDACKKVVDVKDKLIEELRRQMVAKEEAYVSSLKKQADDIDRLIETMHGRTDALVAAYQRELRAIEDAFVQERRELITGNDSDIEGLIKQRNDREKEQTKRREQRVWDDQKVLDDKYEENAEKFNKSKMDNLHDIHGLAQELESLHARFMLNQEKLHYNLRVLNERVNENKKASDLHRKKLGRLQDVLSTLLARYAETDKKFQQTNRELTEGYRRVTEQYKDLQLKFQHFERADAEKYQQVWKMHEDDCMKLVHKCLQADRVVFEEMLGVKWQCPSLDFWLAPAADDTPANGTTGVNEAEGQASATLDSAAISDLGDSAAMMLQIIYTQVPFLVEDKVRRVIDQLEEGESQPLKVEAVLASVGVKTTDDVRQMLEYFVADADDGQTAMINPQEVVRALQRYLHDRASKKQDGTVMKLDLSKLESQKTDQRKKDVQQGQRQREFWARMATVVPDAHLRLWNNMETSMNKYLRQLQKRQDLISSTDALRQQNDELRALLNSYLSSAVNDELFSPPQLQVAGTGSTRS